MSHYNNAGGDTSFRRKWDLDEFRRKESCEAGKEEKAGKGVSSAEVPTVKSEQLLERTDIIDFEARIGQESTSGTQAGFYCKLCNMVLKDSVAYLDHINGRQHLMLMGVSHKVQRATLEQVKKRLELLKRKMEQPEEEYDIDKIVAKREEQERVERERKKQEKKAKKDELRKEKELHDAEFVDQDVAMMMGFGGFGTTKKK